MDGGFHSVVPPVGYAALTRPLRTTTAASNRKGRKGESERELEGEKH